MKLDLDTYTIAIPWYEKADFQRLWELAHDRDEMPPTYEEWHSQATAFLGQALARGKAIQVVTVKPEQFLVWLQERPNTRDERRRYVEQLAANAATTSR